MSYTLKEAADAAGKDRSTLFRAIKSGRLSATKDDSGNYHIDPAELQRVFPVARNTVRNVAMQQDAQAEIALENSELKAKVNLLGQLLEEVTASRDDLRTERNQLLSVIQEQAGTVKQLTYTPEPTTLPPDVPKAAKVRPILWAVLAAVMTAAAFLLWPLIQH